MTNCALGPVVVDLAGIVLSDGERDLLRHPQVGGLIFFSRNFVNPTQLAALIGAVRAVRPELVLMVDQEGGRVQRFREGFTRLPPLQSLGKRYLHDAQSALALARDHAWLMASEMLYAGLDLSLAPVLDCDLNGSAVIGDRAFSDQPQTVIELAGAYMNGLQEAGMAAVAKHFPGHGAVTNDSHITLPVSSLSYAELSAWHMQTFAVLAQRYHGLMPAHIVFTQVDANPVGYSAYWLKQVVREQLKFGGVVFSDDLSMAGAAWAGDYPARAEAALAAGCDVVLVCNAPQGAWQVVEHLTRLGRPPVSRLAELKARRCAAPPALDTLRASGAWQNCVYRLKQLEI